MSERFCDLLIVGAGPAGLAAALQARHDGLDLVLIGDEAAGGMLRAARRIDNFAGCVAGTRGAVLAARLQRRLKNSGVIPLRASVSNIEQRAQKYTATLDDGARLESLALILATGTRPAPYKVAGQKSCLSTGRLLRDLRGLPDEIPAAPMLVVGGGDAALDTALSLRDRGHSVLLAARSTALKARARLVDDARRAGVDLRAPCALVGLKPAEAGLTASLHQAQRGSQSHTFAYVFVCVGRVPCDTLAQELLGASPAAHQIETDIAGLYLAGDVIRQRQRYLASALGDGQRAAVLARQHLLRLQRRE